MLYSEKLKTFSAAHPCEEVTVDGARFRYILCGSAGGKTLVFLNGGMNTLEMWMDYAGALSGDCRVLLFDYPRELRTNQALVTGMHAFFRKLGIEAPILIGASDGGMDAKTLKSLKNLSPCHGRAATTWVINGSSVLYISFRSAHRCNGRSHAG